MNEKLRSYFVFSCIVLLIGYPFLWLTRCIYNIYIDSRSLNNSTETIMRVKHLGIIMDGNRRWASSRGRSNESGYQEGTERLWETVHLCLEEGISHLSIYALSFDNVRKRSEEEFFSICNLIVSQLEKRKSWLIKQGIRIHFVGDFSFFSEEMKNNLQKLEKATLHCDELIIHILISYNSIDDCTYAVRSIAQNVLDGKIAIKDITNKTFKKSMLSGSIPPLDVIIRTGGQERLSGFLPIQSIYSEVIFIPYMWPDVKKEDIRKIVRNFFMRTRNFGR